MDETRTTSQAKLIFPSLLMRIFKAKCIPIPQDLSRMPTPSAINKQTIIRIQVRLPSDVDEEGAKQEEDDPMDTEAEAAEQSSTSRSRAKRNRASTSSAAPPDNFLRGSVCLRGRSFRTVFKFSLCYLCLCFG